MHTFRIRMRSVGNPDFGQYAPLSPPRFVMAGRLRDLRRAVEDYIETWNLGGGNWPTCPVTRDGKVVGFFSYNRRFWRRPRP